MATADAMVKMAPPNIPAVSGHRLPISSEAGAQIRGPDAKPRTYRVVPSVPTSGLTLKALLALLVPGAKIALVNDAVRVPRHASHET